LISGIEFDSIFAGNDQMAIGAMKALKEYGLRIPEDIKVVGFDNTFIASIVEPSLTTVHFPKHQMGIQAAQRLIERIENPDQQAKAIELPIHLIVRQSTDLRGEKAWDLYEW
jgi:DNA-binding LacI/PurR family transcriptional regulator